MKERHYRIVSLCMPDNDGTSEHAFHAHLLADHDLARLDPAAVWKSLFIEQLLQPSLIGHDLSPVINGYTSRVYPTCAGWKALGISLHSRAEAAKPVQWPAASLEMPHPFRAATVWSSCSLPQKPRWVPPTT